MTSVLHSHLGCIRMLSLRATTDMNMAVFHLGQVGHVDPIPLLLLHCTDCNVEELTLGVQAVRMLQSCN